MRRGSAQWRSLWMTMINMIMGKVHFETAFNQFQALNYVKQMRLS